MRACNALDVFFFVAVNVISVLARLPIMPTAAAC